jgi:hypothetical protein
MPDFTDRIRQAVANNNYRLTDHARKRKNKRGVLESEVTAAILQGEVIERRPNAKPLPKCLFMKEARPGQPLYVSCAYNEQRQQARVITIHWRDEKKWLDWRTRRPRRRR